MTNTIVVTINYRIGALSMLVGSNPKGAFARATSMPRIAHPKHNK